MEQLCFYLELDDRRYSHEEAKIWLEAKVGPSFYVVFDEAKRHFIITPKFSTLRFFYAPKDEV